MATAWMSSRQLWGLLASQEATSFALLCAYDVEELPSSDIDKTRGIDASVILGGGEYLVLL